MSEATAKLASPLRAHAETWDRQFVVLDRGRAERLVAAATRASAWAQTRPRSSADRRTRLNLTESALAIQPGDLEPLSVVETSPEEPKDAGHQETSNVAP